MHTRLANYFAVWELGGKRQQDMYCGANDRFDTWILDRIEPVLCEAPFVQDYNKADEGHDTRTVRCYRACVKVFSLVGIPQLLRQSLRSFLQKQNSQEFSIC